MNISGIRPNAGFYEYNSIKFHELRSQQIQRAQQEANQGDAKGDLPRDMVSRDYKGSYEYVDNSEPKQDYVLNDGVSGVRSMNVEQAISDMQKDTVLQQYHFFVGQNSEEAIVDSSLGFSNVENFDL